MGRLADRREGSGLMIGTWPDSLLRFAQHSTDLCVRALRRLLWPKFELGIRLWLAQMFFVSGALKLTHWQTAFHLTSHVYPVALDVIGKRCVRGRFDRFARRCVAGGGVHGTLESRQRALREQDSFYAHWG